MDLDKIKHLEYLSKLKFSEEERSQFESEFESILSFVDDIKGVELKESFEKDEAVSLSALREDKPSSSMSQAEVLANAPKQKDGCYVTPLVVE